MARLREFYRQPEAIFWVYFFPILLVVALGVAFRNKPVERFTVDVQLAPRSSEIVAALGADSRVQVQAYDLAACQQRLRTGKSDLYVVPGADLHSVEYVLDPTRPGSVPRIWQINGSKKRPVGSTRSR